MDDPPLSTRRRLLAGLGGAATSALAGCTDQLWSRAEHASPDRVSVTIKTLPTDDDAAAAKIASQLTENLRIAGIDAVQEPVSEPELYREVLLDRNFDVFVARHPGFDDLDAMRPLLHSQFVSERGWQNPFGFSNGGADDRLETQCRQRGYDRLATFADLFEHLLGNAPYSAVAFPHQVGAAGAEVAVSSPPRNPVEFVDLLRSAGGERRERPLRVGKLVPTLTERLNPIAVDVGDVHSILDALYDPLVRQTDRGYVPWLAETVEWTGPKGPDDSLEATVSLRDGVTWHDGEPIDADDVAFTVQFLEDTSLGEVESGVPAPKFRGRTSLIDTVSVLDGNVQFGFGDRSQEVARRSLTLPLLPKHVWEPKSELVAEQVTEALGWENLEPVGSGLFSFVEVSRNEYVTLEPYEDHVLRSTGVPEYPRLFDGDPLFDGVEFRIVPNAGVAVDDLLDGDIDLVGSPLTPEAVEAVDDGGGTVLESPTRSFYVVGYNLRQNELGNPRFRRIVSQLVDRRYVVEEFFDGNATAAETRNSLVGVAPDAWDHPREEGVPDFPGSDGEADASRVRSLFEEAGYRYDDDGELLA